MSGINGFMTPNNNAGQDAAIALGLPLGQTPAAGAMLAARANINRAVQTRQLLAGVIADAEGTTKFADPYAVGFGGVKIDTNAPHPGNVGKYRGSGVSAAGKYQFTLATWKDMHGGKNVPMTPENQELALDKMLRSPRVKVTEDELRSGNLGAILGRAGPVWASLPSSTAGQPKRDTKFIMDSLRKQGAPQRVMDSLVAAGLGLPHGAPPISATEAKDAAAPRPEERIQQYQTQMSDMQIAQDTQAQQEKQVRERRIDSMIADAVTGTNKLVEAPSDLPTKYDDQLLKIIRAA